MQVKTKLQVKRDFFDLLRKHGVAGKYVINYYNGHYNRLSLNKFLKEKDPSKYVYAPFYWDSMVWHKISIEWGIYLKDVKIIN